MSLDTHADNRDAGRVASKMDLNIKKTSSRALLSCGNGEGLSEKLLLKPKAATALQTERVPRSSVLERLQSFLPQMAEANEKLKQQMADAPAGHFDIESVEGDERVIEMAEDEEETSDSEEESVSGEVTEQNLVLPGDKGKKKAIIQVLHEQDE
ncbi:putative protein C12orf45 [Liparis tanakae]|uniref:Uncharacterized protein n=1 Tax=Liparis tanakae TaxID=230148 RepID=A0A4Z2FH18_9TELE|nr:putative protein C12orf45 [Liparis tanakae]